MTISRRRNAVHVAVIVGLALVAVGIAYGLLEWFL